MLCSKAIHFHESSSSTNEKKTNAKRKMQNSTTIDILLIRQCVKQKCSICNKFECMLVCRYTHMIHIICKCTEYFKHETQFSQIARSISFSECIVIFLFIFFFSKSSSFGCSTNFIWNSNYKIEFWAYFISVPMFRTKKMSIRCWLSSVGE